MTIEAYLFKPANERFRYFCQSHIDYCGGNICAALLIDFFSQWHLRKLGKNQLIGGKVYQHHTIEELREALLCAFVTNTLRKAINFLETKGIITVHKNPKTKGDRTKFYIFHPEKFNAWIKSRLLENENNLVLGTIAEKFPKKAASREKTNALEKIQLTFEATINYDAGALFENSSQCYVLNSEEYLNAEALIVTSNEIAARKNIDLDVNLDLSNLTNALCKNDNSNLTNALCKNDNSNLTNALCKNDNSNLTNALCKNDNSNLTNASCKNENSNLTDASCKNDNSNLTNALCKNDNLNLTNASCKNDKSNLTNATCKNDSSNLTNALCKNDKSNLTNALCKNDKSNLTDALCKNDNSNLTDALCKNDKSNLTNALCKNDNSNLTNTICKNDKLHLSNLHVTTCKFDNSLYNKIFNKKKQEPTTTPREGSKISAENKPAVVGCVVFDNQKNISPEVGLAEAPQEVTSPAANGLLSAVNVCENQIENRLTAKQAGQVQALVADWFARGKISNPKQILAEVEFALLDKETLNRCHHSFSKKLKIISELIENNRWTTPARLRDQNKAENSIPSDGGKVVYLPGNAPTTTREIDAKIVFIEAEIVGHHNQLEVFRDTPTFHASKIFIEEKIKNFEAEREALIAERKQLSTNALPATKQAGNPTTPSSLTSLIFN